VTYANKLALLYPNEVKIYDRNRIYINSERKNIEMVKMNVVKKYSNKICTAYNIGGTR
jgi:hypothetical protein